MYSAESCPCIAVLVQTQLIRIDPYQPLDFNPGQLHDAHNLDVGVYRTCLLEGQTQVLQSHLALPAHEGCEETMLVVPVPVTVPAVMVVSRMLRLILGNVRLLLCGKSSQRRRICRGVVLYAVRVRNCTVLGKLHKRHRWLTVGREPGHLGVNSNVSLVQCLLKGLHVDVDLLLQLCSQSLVYSLGLRSEQSRKTAGNAVDDTRSAHHATAEEDP